MSRASKIEQLHGFCLDVTATIVLGKKVDLLSQQALFEEWQIDLNEIIRTCIAQNTFRIQIRSILQHDM